MARKASKLIFLPIFCAVLAFSFAVRAQDFSGTLEKSDTPIEAESQKVTSLPDSGILPDSPLYPWKIGLEKLVTLLTLKPASRAERYVVLAEKRLSEIRSMVDEGIATEDMVEDNILRFEYNMEKALAYAEKMRKRGEEAAEILAQVSETTKKYQSALSESYDSLPEPTKAAIEGGLEWTKQTYQQVLDTIPEETKEGIAGKWDKLTEKVKEISGYFKDKFKR